MKRGAVRLGDYSSGHDGYPPRPSVTASNDTFVNGRGQVRIGDYWATHCSTKHCHDGTQSQGSKSVFVNGRGAARTRDLISCNDYAEECSSDVFLD